MLLFSCESHVVSFKTLLIYLWTVKPFILLVKQLNMCFHVVRCIYVSMKSIRFLKMCI